jgi:hypothetical protein
MFFFQTGYDVNYDSMTPQNFNLKLKNNIVIYIDKWHKHRKYKHFIVLSGHSQAKPQSWQDLNISEQQ